MSDSRRTRKQTQSESEEERQARLAYHRRYYLENRAALLAQSKEYRERNKEAKRARDKAYYEANKEKIRERSKSPAGRAIQKRSREKNKLAISNRYRRWREKNREYLRAYKKQRRLENPHLALINRIRCRTWWAIRNASARKNNRTLELLGCTAKELSIWIQSQFSEGMCWEKLGEIHIDHFIPLAAFDLSDADQQRAAFHYTNLRPMWGIDNKRKSDKVPGQSLFGFAYAAKIAQGMGENKKSGRQKRGWKHGDD